MSDRTFFVRMNLDDMATDLIGLDSTEERGLWLEGFVVGSRGKGSRTDWPSAKLEGHSFGLKCFNEAEEFRDKQAAKGLASAESRRNRKPTEHEPEFNHGSTAVQPEANQTSTYPTTNNQQLTTNNDKPKKARQAAFDPGMFDEMIPEQFAANPTFVECWHDWVSSRHERKKPISERAARQQMRILQGFGVSSVAMESIRQSIANDWQGLFMPKQNGFVPAQSSPPAETRELTYEEQQMRLPMAQRWKQ